MSDKVGLRGESPPNTHTHVTDTDPSRDLVGLTHLKLTVHFGLQHRMALGRGLWAQQGGWERLGGNLRVQRGRA